MKANPVLFYSLSLFADISESHRVELLQASQSLRYRKGETILTGFQPPPFLYVISGWIKLFKDSAAGDEVIVDILTAHHCYGESFLFQHTESWLIAEAISNTQILTIPLPTLQGLMQSEPRVLLKFLELSLQKQEALNMEIEHLSIQNAEQRIGCFLLRLLEGEAQQSVTLTFPFAKSLLASRLGMKAETFSRALHKLSQKCKLTLAEDKIDIPEVRTLVEYVCQHCSLKYPCKKIFHDV